MPLFLPNSGVTAPLTLNSGTITADAPALNLSQTWNNGAVVFNALQVEATTTANAAGSTLLRLRANGSTVASVSNGGTLTCSGNGTFTTGTLTLGTTVLLQDVSVNNLALRNSTNAQTFNLYGTYTDSGNYRRLRTTMTTAGAVTIAAEGLGTGVSGNTLTLGANGSDIATLDVGGLSLLLGYIQMTQIAPASPPGSNKARIYIDKPGSKMRLMVIFNTGAAQQIAIEP